MTYEQVWDLESVFSGGSNSPELQEKLKHYKLILTVSVNW